MIKKIFIKNRNIKYLKKIILKAIIYATLISMIFSISGCSLIPKEEEVLAPKLKEPPKVVYDTVEIKKSTFEKKVEVTGNFIPIYHADLSFLNSNGRLKSINVGLHENVKKGDILAELITDDLDTKIKQQEIALTKSKLNIAEIKLNGQKDIDILKNQLDSLKKKLENMVSIPDAYSKEEIKDLKDQIAEKEIVYKNSLAIYQNNIKVAESDAELCKVLLNSLRQTLNNSRLTSPIDGVVYYLTDILEGGNIDAYTTVVSIADFKDLQLSYSGDKIDQFNLGTKVRVITMNASVIEGEVVMTPGNVPLDADETAKSSIRIKVKNLPSDVLIGDYASIILSQIKKENVIVINKNIIRSAGKRKFVSVLENGLKKERDIETGDENQTEIVVVKGLSVGDQVIK